MSPEPSAIATRKSDHIDIVLTQDVGFGRLSTGFSAVHFVHNALPELRLEDIDLATEFAGRSLKAPLLISSMTGGPAKAETINRHLAEAANALGIALAIGSQRIALEEQGAGGMTRALRAAAPNVPLIGNIGAAQLLGPAGVDRARRAIDMIGADALYVHLNPLQEAVQDGGDTDWRGILGAIVSLVEVGVPVVVKEVGFGLSADVISRLSEAGVTAFDVAGAGGTNWARVEAGRHDGLLADVAQAFTEWGIPTARAIADARAAAPDATIIGSGGIKDGVEAAKAIRLGADLIGQAAAVLGPALESTDAVIIHFEKLINTLRVACFVTGSRSISALRRAPLLTAAD